MIDVRPIWVVGGDYSVAHYDRINTSDLVPRWQGRNRVACAMRGWFEYSRFELPVTP